MANRYGSKQREHGTCRAWFDAVLAAAPMTSLVAGLGLGLGGYLTADPGMAAGGAVVMAVGLYVERLQARALKRRRRAERLRSRHEVTELRRTIAQLRIDVGAFQRALLDTEAVLAAWSLPMLMPVPPAVPPAVAALDSAPADSAPAAPAPVTAPGDDALVVPLAQPEASDWVQTPARDSSDEAGLPPQLPSPFVAEAAASPPALTPALTPRRERLTPKADALVYAALAALDADAAAGSLAHLRDAEDASGGASSESARTVA